jgi:hypothetical protein
VLLDELAQHHLAREHREQVVAGDELEVVEQAVIARVGHGHREGPTLALQRQHDVLRRHLARNQLEDAGVDLEFREVHGRHAELAREQLGDLQLGHEPQPGHRVTQALLGRSCLRLGRLQLLASQQSFLQKEITQQIGPYRHRCHRPCRIRV